MLDESLRCRLGIHDWTLVDGFEEFAPQFTPVECRRCGVEMDRLPYFWFDADGLHARIGATLIPPEFIALGLVILVAVYFPIIEALVALVGAIL